MWSQPVTCEESPNELGLFSQRSGGFAGGLIRTPM